MSENSPAYQLLERLRSAQLRLAAVALIIMMCVTLADITLRALFNSPVRGSYELVEFMLVIFVFHGMSTALLQRRSIVIDLADTFAGKGLINVLVRLSDVLTVLVLILFAYAMIKPAVQSYNYGELRLELQLPIYIIWVVALLGMAGAILCAIGVFFIPASTRHGGPVE